MNVDHLKLFPDQRTDGDPHECVGLVVTDIAGNIDGQAYDPDFTYAMTLLLENHEPTTGGADPFAGMQSAVAYGLLPASEETFTALSMGELYVANWQNYSAGQRRDALAYAKAGVKNILGNGDDFDSIKRYIEATGWGASVSVTWFSSFLNPVNGILPTPSGAIDDHNIAVYGTTVIDGDEYLIAKPLLGKQYGDGGYCYISREFINTICEGARGFDPDAKRWHSLVGIAVTKLNIGVLAQYVPQLLALDESNMQTENGNKLYQTAAQCLGHKLTAGDAADGYGTLGCAETVNSVAQKAWGHPIGGGLSTAAMWEYLKDKTKYEFVTAGGALPGDIIISPTGTVPGAKLAHGHVGIVAKYGVLSNNSETGTLEENYSIASWTAYFTTYGGLPTLIYRPL